MEGAGALRYLAAAASIRRHQPSPDPSSSSISSSLAVSSSTLGPSPPQTPLSSSQRTHPKGNPQAQLGTKQLNGGPRLPLRLKPCAQADVALYERLLAAEHAPFASPAVDAVTSPSSTPPREPVALGPVRARAGRTRGAHSPRSGRADDIRGAENMAQLVLVNPHDAYALRINAVATSAFAAVAAPEELLLSISRCVRAPLLGGPALDDAGRTSLLQLEENIFRLYMACVGRNQGLDPGKLQADIADKLEAQRQGRSWQTLIALELERQLSDVRFERHPIYSSSSFPNGGYAEWKRSETARITALLEQASNERRSHTIIHSKEQPALEPLDGDYHGLHAHHDNFRALLRLCLTLDHVELRGGLSQAPSFGTDTARLLAEYANQYGIDPVHAALVEFEALESCLAPGSALLKRAARRLRMLQADKRGEAEVGETTRTRLNTAETVRLQSSLGGIRRHLYRMLRNLPELFSLPRSDSIDAIGATVRLLDAVLGAQKLRALEAGSGPKLVAETASHARQQAVDGSTVGDSVGSPRRPRSGSASRSRHQHHRTSRGPTSGHGHSHSHVQGRRSSSSASGAGVIASMPNALSDLLHDMVELQMLRQKAFLLGYPLPLLAEGEVGDRSPDRALAGKIKATTLAGEQLQRLALLMAADVADWSKHLPRVMPQADVQRLCVSHTFDQLMHLVGRLCFFRLAENRSEAIDADLVRTAAFVRLLYRRWARLLPHDAELRWQNPFVSLALRWLDQAQHAAELEVAEELAAFRADASLAFAAEEHPIVCVTNTWLSAILVFGGALVSLFETEPPTRAQGQGHAAAHDASVCGITHGSAQKLASSPPPSKRMEVDAAAPSPTPASPPVSPVQADRTRAHLSTEDIDDSCADAIGPADGAVTISGAARQVVQHLHFVLHSLLRHTMLGLIRLDMPLIRLRADVVSSLDADFLRRISQGDALLGMSALQGAGDQSWVVLDHPTHSTLSASIAEESGLSETHSWAKDLPSTVMQNSSSPLLQEASPDAEVSATSPTDPSAGSSARKGTGASATTPSPRGYIAISSHTRKHASEFEQSKARAARPRGAHPNLRSNPSESGVHITSDDDAVARSEGQSGYGVVRKSRGRDSAVDADFRESASDSSGRHPTSPRGKGRPASQESSRQSSPVRSMRMFLPTSDRRHHRQPASQNVKFNSIYGSSPTSAQQYILDTLAPILQVPVSSTACYRLNILQALLSLLPSLHDDMCVRLTAGREHLFKLPTASVHHYLESLVQYHAGILLSCTVDWVSAALPPLLSRRAQESSMSMSQCLKPLTHYLERHLMDYKDYLQQSAYDLMYERIWRRVLDILLFTAAVEPPAMFRVQRHQAVIYYRALRVLVHFFNHSEPQLCPMSHIRAATGNTARVLQMLQHPTPALVAFYHRVCYQQLADIAMSPDPETEAHNMPLRAMATPESSVEYLLQARQHDMNEDEPPVRYTKESASPILTSRLPSLLAPLLTAETSVSEVGASSSQSRAKLRRSVVCSLVLAKLEHEATSSLPPIQAHVHAEYCRTGAQLATECLRDLLLEDKKLRDHGLFMVDETCISAAELITWLVDYGTFESLMPETLPYGGGPERRTILRQRTPSRNDWGIVLRGREVRSVRRSSIADEAGLLEGDLVIHINGRDVTQCQPEDVAQLLRTPLPLTEELRDDPSLTRLVLGDIVLLVESRSCDFPNVRAPSAVATRSAAKELMTFLVSESLLHPLNSSVGGQVADRSDVLYRFTTDDIRHGVRPMGPPPPSELASVAPFDAFGPVTPTKRGVGTVAGWASYNEAGARAPGSEGRTFAPGPTPPASPQRPGQGGHPPSKGASGSHWRARTSVAQLQLRRPPNHSVLLWREVLLGLRMSDYCASEAAHVKAQLQHVLGARQLDPRAMLFHTRLPDPPADSPPNAEH